MLHSRAIVSVFLSAGFALAAFARRATAQGVDLLQRHQFGTMDRQARSKDREGIDARAGTVKLLTVAPSSMQFLLDMQSMNKMLA